MVKLYTLKEMLALEQEANNSGLSYDLMMENAGKSLADEIVIAYRQTISKTIFALVGSGNNGGDALVALDHLILQGWRGTAYIVKTRKDGDSLVSRFKKNGGRLVHAASDKDFQQLKELVEQSDVMIDGVFGTGIKLPLTGEAARILSLSKDWLTERNVRLRVVAVDCPSGIDCETGEVAGETIPADLTVTMAGIKSGMINSPAMKYLGELRIGNIGNLTNLSTFQQNNKIVLDKEIIQSYLPKRSSDAHKGTFGTALIVAGSVNYTGAAFLSGKAAYRSGVGLVTLAVPEPLHAALAGQIPESTWILLPHERGFISRDASAIVKENSSKVSAVLLGPGFGLQDTTADFIHSLFSSVEGISQVNQSIDSQKADQRVTKLDKPVVVDADGLKLLTKSDYWYDLLPPDSILTPHPGEMSVLTGLPADQIQKNRIELARKYSKKWGHIIVLKSAYTIIAAPDGRIGVVPVATPALARAGTGDVLAGIIVGLRAQGVNPFEAACAGAWIHAQAGLFAAQQLGTTMSVIASDVLNAIPQVISSITS